MILVDASKGLLAQIFCHSCLVGLVGIRQAVLVVNRMDLVGYRPAVFDGIEMAYREVARRMADAGLVVLVARISPFRAERAFVRSLLSECEFIEIFVDAPLSVAEARDPKGLCARARPRRTVELHGHRLTV